MGISARSDGIVVEILAASEDFALKISTEIIKDISDSGNIKKDLCGCIFIVLT